MTEIKTGTVYKISTEKSDKVYVGSTTQPLNRRFTKHKSRPCCACKELLELGECKIEALEVLYNCTKRELEIKEQFYLDLLNEKAVNKKRAHQTKEQRKQQRKESRNKCRQKWREENRDEYNEQQRNYRLKKKSNSEAV